MFYFRNLILLFIVSLSLSGYCQKSKYILFNKETFFKYSPIGSYKLFSNDVKLIDSAGNYFHIYNLYYDKNDFSNRALYPQALFRKACGNFNLLGNDILITITPISVSLKKIPLSKNDLKKLNIITAKELLQTAIKKIFPNLFNVYTPYVYSNPPAPPPVKTFEYKLILKEDNKYYLIDENILTEFYIIYNDILQFPIEYKYPAIIYHSLEENNPITQKYISEMLSGNNKNDGNNLSRKLTNKIYYSGMDTSIISGLTALNYWTFPQNGLFIKKGGKVYGTGTGTGGFKFMSGVGIINGTFDLLFNNTFLYNSGDISFDDKSIKYHLKIESIDDIKVEDFKKVFLNNMPKKTIYIE